MQLKSSCRSCRFAIAAALLALSTLALADPWASPGDVRLRHDLQLLADYGLLDAPLTTWPLAFGDIAASLSLPEDTQTLPPGLRATLARVQRRIRRETRTGVLELGLAASAAEEPVRLRSFADTPREEGELAARVSWMGGLFAWRLQTTAVADPSDDKDFRLDGSYFGVALGNWMLSLGSQPRWWGPGWDGSLILGTAARPVTAIAFERNRSYAFDLPVLRWLGPWDFVTFLGELEQNRFVPDAKLFGMRLTFKPTDKLEIGLSRTAQWGGEGRPEDFDTFLDMLWGNDNVGEGGLTLEEEPGNQIAGFDMRWQSPLIGRLPYALYAQFIGEDQSGNLPSGYYGLAGLEQWGRVGANTYRLYLEAANTMASFYDDVTATDGPRPNYAYEHGRYRSGYRYYGRPLGHPADGDSRMYSLGLLLAPDDGGLWSFQLQRALLNYDDDGDRHSLSPGQETEVLRAFVTHGRLTRIGMVEMGLGAARFETDAERDTEARAFLRWSVNWH